MVAVDLVVENRDEVYRAFAGADFVFLVTNIWEHLNVEKMLIDAAKAAGVKGIVWSGLVSVTKASGGKYTKVVQFDGKAAVTEHGRASGVPFVTVQAGLYASSFAASPVHIQQLPDGTHAIQWATRPTALIPIIDMENDYGLYVRRVLELPVFPDGSDVYTSSEDITVEEMARQISEVTGKKVVFNQLTIEEFSKPLKAVGAPPPMVDAIVEVFRFWDEFGYYGGQPSADREGLARPTRTWREFVKSSDWSKVLG
ncbi:NAD(P)-binding protein [Mycena vitilis]|nr:NAD(P)-binding protein [Mycena vitilis]